ncbi:MAG: FAD:protein FMN transferase [Gammaproteobacteria bacterium]|nr:FAD:protein FMN transferase [Gammaproteobacteria bacterium]
MSARNPIAATTARFLSSAACGLLLLINGSVRAEWVSQERAIMGTRIAVELWSQDAAAAAADIEAVMREMHRVDKLMSTYKPTSQVSLVNAEAARRSVAVDADLFGLLQTALEYSRLTEGAFDITYASVGYLYDYRNAVKPSDEEIARALPAVDYRHVMLDPAARTVRFAQPGVRIDLGGIAKGWAVDQGIQILRARGVERAMVSAGGDTRILGDRLGKPWMVGIRDPRQEGKVILRVPLDDAALSTSGDYERFFESEGVRYHHILEPSSGKPARAVRSVTVIGPTATRTDGLSKTIFVLGIDRGMRILDRLGDVDAIAIDHDGQVFYSRGLQQPP